MTKNAAALAIAGIAFHFGGEAALDHSAACHFVERFIEWIGRWAR